MQNFKNISKMNLRIRTHTFRTEEKMHAILLLRASCISRQQTVLLSDFCLVPRPHFSSRPKRFGSRGPCDREGLGNVVQGLGNSDLRFLVQWSICDCCAVQSAVCLSDCSAAAPVFLLRTKQNGRVAHM